MAEPWKAFEADGLGLSRDGTVTLAPADPRWRRAFTREAARLATASGWPLARIHHVGSTAVPMIAAKPILDILLEAPSPAMLDEPRAALEALGYEWKGEYGIPGRRYCVLYDGAGATGYVHLHAFAAGNPEVARHLVFRDYLLAHPARARDYEALKIRLAGSVKRAAYSEGKAALLGELLREAQRWRGE